MRTWLLRVLLAVVLACSVTPAYAGRTLIDTDNTTSQEWTPSVGGTATYTTQTGRYLRYGNLVIAWCRLTINTIGTGSTTVISGLPYPVDLTPVVYAAASVYFHTLAASVTTVTALAGSGGASSVTLYSLTSAGTTMGANAILGNGSDLYFSVMYVTDAAP